MNTSLIITVVIVIVLVGILIYFLPFQLWFKAFVAGVDVSLIDLFFLKIRGVNPSDIVDTMIISTKSGLNLKVEELEKHSLAEVNIKKVVTAMVTARQGNIPLNLETACAIYLSGKDVLEAVKISINTHVIKTSKITSTCEDGIQLHVQARITVRTNINQYIGGAGEDTILAKVGEGIVAAVGSATSHQDLLKNPGIIVKAIESQKLDQKTAYRIVSIDIADIDIGDNMGAKLRSQDAKSEEAKAEAKLSQAVADEQFMRVKAQEAKAKLIEAQAQIPLAIARALENGNISLSDYLKYKNVEADTNMRESIADMNKNDQPVDREQLNDKLDDIKLEDIKEESNDPNS